MKQSPRPTETDQDKHSRKMILTFNRTRGAECVSVNHFAAMNAFNAPVRSAALSVKPLVFFAWLCMPLKEFAKFLAGLKYATPQVTKFLQSFVEGDIASKCFGIPARLAIQADTTGVAERQVANLVASLADVYLEICKWDWQETPPVRLAGAGSVGLDKCTQAFVWATRTVFE